jgi:hypothetical protein
MIADGESQSAGRMVTYVNAIHPVAQVFNGFFIHSRSAAGAGLFAGGGGAVPSPSKIRSDVPPVLVFETETDTAGHFNARQPDGANYRLWEGTGTAHVDNYDFTFFNANAATSEPSYPPTVCNFPNNMANERYLMNAALFGASFLVATNTCAPGRSLLLSAGTMPTTGALEGTWIVFSPLP